MNTTLNASGLSLLMSAILLDRLFLSPKFSAMKSRVIDSAVLQSRRPAGQLSPRRHHRMAA